MKDCYFTVVKAQKYSLHESLYLFYLGTDCLHKLFGVLQTLTHNCNSDLLQCVHRLSHATHIHQIYQCHPDWKQKAKRLEGSLDCMNLTSWKGTVHVVLCWFDERAKCVETLTRTGCFSSGELDFDTLLQQGYTICWPDGKWVGLNVAPKVVEDLPPTGPGQLQLEDGEEDSEDMLPGGDTSSGLVEAYVKVEGCRTHKFSVVC